MFDYCSGEKMQKSTTIFLLPTLFLTFANAKNVAQAPQPSGLTCTLAQQRYDMYFLIDISNLMPYSVLSTLNQTLISFIEPYTIGPNNVQVAIVAVDTNAERLYTGFHQGQDLTSLVNTLAMLFQSDNIGQLANVAFYELESDFLNFQETLANPDGQLAIYFTGNTNFDYDPQYNAQRMFDRYGLNTLTVKVGSMADATKLQAIANGPSCFYDASSSQAGLANWLWTATCMKSWCRSN